MGTAIPSVTFENKAGAYAMVEHLLRCGHRRIAFLAGPSGNEDASWRALGYRQALAHHDILVTPALIGQGDFDDSTAERVVEDWLRSDLEMDAIFAGDDVSAQGAMRAVQAAGLRIPHDIAVVGFDDTILSRYLNPPLTTVHAPIEEAGHCAAERLISQIRGEPVAPLTLLPTELVIRDSCGWRAVMERQRAFFDSACLDSCQPACSSAV